MPTDYLNTTGNRALDFELDTLKRKVDRLVAASNATAPSIVQVYSQDSYTEPVWLSNSGVSDWANVLDFGAHGDGVIDDITAIQEAIDSKQETGGIVYFPRGKYLISGALKLWDGISLLGCGIGYRNAAGGPSAPDYDTGSIIVGNNLTGPLIQSQDLTNRYYHWSIKDLALDNQTSANAGAIGIDLTKVSRSTLLNVLVRNCETGFKLASPGATKGCYYNELFACRAEDIVTGFRIEDGANDNHVWGGQANNCTTGAIVDGTTNVGLYHVAIENFTTGVSVSPTAASQYTKIVGVRLENVTSPGTGTGILISATAQAVLVLSPQMTTLLTDITNNAGTELSVLDDRHANPRWKAQEVRFSSALAGSNIATIFPHPTDGTHVGIKVRDPGNSTFYDVLCGQSVSENASWHGYSRANKLKIDGAAGGGGVPYIEAQGSDANVHVKIAAKGSGGQVQLYGVQCQLGNGFDNFVLVNAAATGGDPSIVAYGVDTNIDLELKPQGADGTIECFGKQLIAALDKANYCVISGANASSPVVIQALGSDSVINIQLKPKDATGYVQLFGGVAELARESANYIQASGAAGGSAPTIAVAGSDTNINLQLLPKGTGDIYANGPLRISGALDHNGTTVGFYNVTPVTRPTAYTQTYATATRTHAAATADAVSETAATTSTPWGYTTQAQADSLPVEVNDLRDDLLNLKQVVNSIIDDLQAVGICQ
jgi:hypothetical protein